MSDADDRLVGDPVWELFPAPPAEMTPDEVRARRVRYWLTAAGAVAAAWLVSSHLAVVTACLSAGFRNFRDGRRLARAIPDEAGGRICALFSDAWGAWKVGIAGFAMMFLSLLVLLPRAGAAPPPGGRTEPPAFFLVAVLFWLGGFTASAVLASMGLWKAYRSGMRVWIGEGVNQARTLLGGMLIVGFVYFALGPACFWLTGRVPAARDGRPDDFLLMLGLLGVMFMGAVMILILLDWMSRHVVADKPGKFGPKVPTVGKWDS